VQGVRLLKENGYNWNISEKVGITCVFFLRGFGKRRKEGGVGFLEKNNNCVWILAFF